MQRIQSDNKVSAETQWAIKVFNSSDYAFEIAETKDFVPGNPNTFVCKTCGTLTKVQANWWMLDCEIYFSTNASRLLQTNEFM